ncbi:MAG: hypothetical protein GYA15_10545 [Leptolinea sp.]|jgi:hypothetical protein|nr:hypothetical protein [Leptolinea sp.]
MGQFPADELKNLLIPILGAAYLMLRASDRTKPAPGEKEVVAAIGSLEEARDLFPCASVRDLADGFKALAAGKIQYGRDELTFVEEPGRLVQNVQWQSRVVDAIASSAEARQYRYLVAFAAEKAACANKEGGYKGPGAQPLSEAEAAVLTQLKSGMAIK